MYAPHPANFDDFFYDNVYEIIIMIDKVSPLSNLLNLLTS